MSDRRQRLRLGIFILISFLLLAGLILLFGGAPEWFLTRTRYTIVFSDAPGVSVGTPVRKSGVKIGEVDKIDLDPDTGQVRVDVRLDKDKYQPRTSDAPTMTRGLLTGDTSIEFFPRDPQRPQRGELISPGATIAGIVPPTARQVLEQASDIIPEAQLSLNQIRMSMQRIEQLAPQFEKTLKEIGELSRVAREFVPELQRGFADFSEMLAGAKDIGPEFRKTNEELRFFLRTASVWTENVGLMLKTNEPRLQAMVDSITRTLDESAKVLNDENRKNFTELLRNLTTASRDFPALSKESSSFVHDGRTTLQEFNKTLAQGNQVLIDLQKATGPIAERAPRVMQNLESSSEQLARTMLDVRDMLKEINRADGSFQRFLSDPSLYNNVNSAADSVARMMPSLQRVLRDLEVFADKIARHPESLGIGGAVRPSAGLKEAPGSTTPRPRNP